MKGQHDQRREIIAECTTCGRLYRVVADPPPPMEELDCLCGSDEFTERTGVVSN